MAAMGTRKFHITTTGFPCNPIPETHDHWGKRSPSYKRPGIAHCESHESLYIVSSVSRRDKNGEHQFQKFGCKVDKRRVHAVPFVSFKAKVVSSESVRNAAELHCFIKNRDAVRGASVSKN